MLLRTVKLVSAVIFAVLFGGCVAATRIPPDTMGRIKTVGVVSIAAHEFNRKYTGFTMFGNEEEKHDISSWNLDDEYEEQMLNALSVSAPFKPKRVPYDRKEFYRVYYRTPSALRTLKWESIEESLKDFAGKHSLDAVIVLAAYETEDFLARTNQHLRGCGFYARGMGDMTSVSVLHLFATVAVIDGRTGKPVAIRVMVPTIKVPPDLSRSKFGDLSSQTIAEVRSMLVDLP